MFRADLETERGSRTGRPRGLKPAARRCAVTLLEVVLAVSLLILLSGTTFWFYRNTLEGRAESLQASQRLRLARTLIDQMSREIRNASSFTPGYGAGLVGAEEWIKVFTTRLPRRILSEKRTERDDKIAGEFDLMEVKYYVARHDEIQDENGDPLALGMVRKETRTLRIGRNQADGNGEGGAGSGDGSDPNGIGDGTGSGGVGDGTGLGGGGSGTGVGGFGGGLDGVDPSLGRAGFETGRGQASPNQYQGRGEEATDELTTVKEELYAPEIKYLRFHYFDGSRWWPTWRLNGSNSLPQIVRITIGFEARPPINEMDEEEDLFLTDPENQDPLPADEYTVFVRVLESDIFFGSRVTRTAQDVTDRATEKAQGF